MADLAVVPMQDYLNLGEEGRMNIPGVAGGNWSWRMEESVGMAIPPRVCAVWPEPMAASERS